MTMHSHLRNTTLSFLLLLIVTSAVKCGSSVEESTKAKETTAKTYKNLAPGVKYVGSVKCRQCHYDKYQSFIETGMGKSFDLASKTKSSAKFDAHSVVYDKFSDMYYHPFWSGDTMKIMEFRKEGKDTVHKRIETVNYIIGSGHHTNSHISSINGYLHQMPLTFYTQDGKWDLPPGYENGYNSRFSRKIGLECMSCHNSLPEFVEGSENNFTSVPGGIGCERCHGPGENHVDEKMLGIKVDTSKEIDYSIVNPAKLSIDLQFDVCQRCHLQGNAVLKEGKSFYDFKPGMKLSDVMSIFLPKYEGADDEFIMASHADRLKQSMCFVKSGVGSQESGENKLRPYKNGMTCITCHNPHVSVKVTGKEVFNTACKNCHGGKTEVLCSEKQETRNQREDNCVSCHMPRSGSIDIPHVTVTDHFIRKPVKKTDVASVKKFIGLFAINEKDPSPHVKAEAYINQFEKFDKDPILLDSAKKYLDEKNTSDFNLLIHLFFLKNDFQSIIAASKKIATSQWLASRKASYANSDAWTSYRIAEAYHQMGRQKEAYPFYRSASELAPYNLEFMSKLAGNLFSLNKPEEAKKIYEKIIDENPQYAPALCNLGYIYFLKQDFTSAENYYDRSLALDPDYEIALMNKVQLYIVKGNTGKAKEILSKLLRKDPKNEKAKEILKQINSLHS